MEFLQKKVVEGVNQTCAVHTVHSHPRTCGGVAHSRKCSECTTIANTDHTMTEHSTSDNLADVSWIQKATLTAVQEECATPSHVQVHHCTGLTYNLGHTHETGKIHAPKVDYGRSP